MKKTNKIIIPLKNKQKSLIVNFKNCPLNVYNCSNSCVLFFSLDLPI